MVCIDSSFLIEVFRGNEDALSLLHNIEEREEIYIPSPVVTELFVGARSEKETNKINTVLSQMSILPLDYESSKIAGKILNDLKKQGNIIGFADALIAGISISNQEPILTLDKKHFQKITGVRFF